MYRQAAAGIIAGILFSPVVFLFLVLLLGCSTPYPSIKVAPPQKQIICTEIGDTTYCRHRG